MTSAKQTVVGASHNFAAEWKGLKYSRRFLSAICLWKAPELNPSILPNPNRALSIDLYRVPRLLWNLTGSRCIARPHLDTGRWSMEGRKGTREVMEIPATAAALADPLLTNTLPGKWISSRSFQLRWGRGREKDQEGLSKKYKAFSKSWAFKETYSFIQSFKVRLFHFFVDEGNQKPDNR